MEQRERNAGDPYSIDEDAPSKWKPLLHWEVTGNRSVTDLDRGRAVHAPGKARSDQIVDWQLYPQQITPRLHRRERVAVRRTHQILAPREGISGHADQPHDEYCIRRKRVADAAGGAEDAAGHDGVRCDVK